MTVHIGFTGTQSGTTSEQQTTVHRTLVMLGATDLAHGDCVGADSQADDIARELGLRVHLHPPSDPRKRAWCIVPPADPDLLVIYSAKPYLERNRDIVDACEALIAAPKESAETLRSGTWATIRYCRKVGKPIFIVWPDGTGTEERP